MCIRDRYSFILRATSKERLLTLFVKGLYFVFDNDFPSAELRAEFKGLHEHYGVLDVYKRQVYNFPVIVRPINGSRGFQFGKVKNARRTFYAYSEDVYKRQV